jgi:hypothetical protein
MRICEATLSLIDKKLFDLLTDQNTINNETMLTGNSKHKTQICED